MTHVSESDSRPNLSHARLEPHPFDTVLARTDYPGVADLVLSRAAVIPDAVAIRWAQGEVTYRRLADAALGAARMLQPGERIGILGGKSPATVAALIGALSAGAVAVPMDEKLPRRRLETMIGLAEVSRVLLTEPSSADPPAGVEVRRLTLDGLVEGAELPPRSVRPDDPGYIFFTSGTTGAAKAVLGCHRGLDHFIAWETTEFGVRSGDRVAQLTTLSFDAMLRDVFVPLTRGATLCLPSATDLDDVGRTVDWLARERITIVHTTPSVVSAWLSGAGPDSARLSRLRLLCLAGEPLTGRLVARLRERLLGPDTEVVNFYGPTETTMIKSFHRVTADQGLGPVPIGRALPGSQAVVLDDADRPCGPGERGEIVLRTPYRTLGYIGGSSAFHPNPRSTDPADLVYRTGDLAIVDADGQIRIEGRGDDLLKVRGTRVHPAEVAAELATHPEVAQVHVEADKHGGGALVVYVVRTPDSALTAETLRDYARDRMPPALVPGLFRFTDQFALLPNGKLDRASLSHRPEPTAERIAPRDETEQSIHRIWSELLGHQKFGVTDDFFAVGGHSLLATVLLARLRRSTGAALSLRQLLEGPRIEHLAKAVSGRTAASAGPGSAVLLPLRIGAPAGPTIFLVHPVGGDALCFRDLAAALPAQFTAIGVSSPGLENGTVFRTVQDMAVAYLYEIQQVQPPEAGPYHFAGWSMGGVVAYEMARQLSFEGFRTASVTLLDSYAHGAGAFNRFADPDTDRVQAFAKDLEGLTGEQLDTRVLRAVHEGASADDEEAQSLLRRYRVFDANATALANYRLRRARLQGTRFDLVLAGDQKRPDGCTATLGWAEALGIDLDTTTVPDTNHMTLLRDPAARTAAEKIADAVVASMRRSNERD